LGITVLRPFLGTLIFLGAAVLALVAGPALPPSLAGLKTLGPYALLASCVALALWFNRGRSFVLALSLLAAYAGHSWGMALGEQGAGARVLYLAGVVLVPANALAALLSTERGIRHRQALIWLLVLGAEVALLAWGAGAVSAGAASAWPSILDSWVLRSPPAPLVGRLAFAVALAAAIWRAWPAQAPLDVGAAGALVAFYIGANWAESPSALAAFNAAAGAILLVSLVQESYRLAFRDALTGLPNRRALEERMRALGDRYTLAMADIDHFKRFNDTHGHDIGDQVLRLVAARLAEVEGGATAYRYGGEEFTLLFPDQSLEQAMPCVKKSCESIARHKMAMRGDDRPKSVKEGSKRRGAGQAEQALSVTVSIGAAERTGECRAPDEVLKAADAALYRAKQSGRNRVSV